MRATTGQFARRLLPTDTLTGDIAAELLARIEDAPLISPHSHVDARLLASNTQFRDPAELLVTGDHYLTRLLHACGVDLDRLGVGRPDADPRQVWRVVCSYWHVFAGTATGYWMAEELAGVFGIREELSARTADDVYDIIQQHLGMEAFRPRALFERFKIDVLATTDDPLDDLEDHARLQADGFRVLPTFRPDRLLDPEAPDFAESVNRLLATTSTAATFGGYLSALEQRRQYFISHGGVSADHGVFDTWTADLSPMEAESLFARVLSGTGDTNEIRLFRAHMLFQMARMSVDDGLVMTLHPGVYRNHSSATLSRYGANTGHDLPVTTTFVEGLRPLLERFGLERDFHLVLFTVDETTFSRELAPLAGFYPSIYIGAPWWFLDAPDAIGRFRAAVTETAGFYRGSGFIDDTRAFLSIPARHNTARRADAAFLARLVADGRVSMAAAEHIIEDLVDSIPKKAFKL
ncbi:glucuronate isomerase [Leifsonia sp. 2MCAF36]|uniref:glucuronate isomerase n=1 Tax=Leifsonia sp. 2MCAF36 TaxID=3232988 RepID=UPI003F97E031